MVRIEFRHGTMKDIFQSEKLFPLQQVPEGTDAQTPAGGLEDVKSPEQYVRRIQTLKDLVEMKRESEGLAVKLGDPKISLNHREMRLEEKQLKSLDLGRKLGRMEQDFNLLWLENNW